MTLEAPAFVLISETGQAPGLGLLCSGARYAGVLWPGAGRIDLRFATPANGQAIERK